MFCLFLQHAHFGMPRVIPAVTALKYRDAMNLAVGTSTGQVCKSLVPSSPSMFFTTSSPKILLPQSHPHHPMSPPYSSSFLSNPPPPPPPNSPQPLLQVLLYDLRSPTPLLVKDHYYSSPIHSIAFQTSNDLVLSADNKILKIWHQKDVTRLPPVVISVVNVPSSREGFSTHLCGASMQVEPHVPCC